MCGFAGIYLNQGSADKSLLQRMTNLIKHRGPDDEGYCAIHRESGKIRNYSGKDSVLPIKEKYPAFPDEFEANLLMGFRRLSILDVSAAGHQPMSYADQNLQIVFNGEIYNYRELRQELKNLGYSFCTNSDTEVILAAYSQWGQDCVKHFIGMWAFALWDNRNKLLFCSRDPFGIKPLYYLEAGENLYFASEIKQLRICPGQRELMLPMLWRSMKINAMLVYEDQTFWQDVKALKAGTNLIVTDAGKSLATYYLPDVQAFETSSLSFDAATTKYRELFEDSLRLQMRSDVPVGSCLSGGLDSSAIVCLAAKMTSGDFHTFSSWYAGDRSLDERKWIDIVCKHSSSVSHLTSPSAEQTWKDFDAAVYYNDLPPGAGFGAQYAVMRLAAESGIKVLLDGQGSDELSAGYKHANYRYFADLARNIKLGELASQLPPYLKSLGFGKSPSAMAKIALSALLPETALYKLEFDHYRFEPFNRDFVSSAKAMASEGILAGIEDISASRLSNFLYNMMRYSSVQTLLHYEDRMSMAHSVESRVPFLDIRLVDFIFSLPSAYKIAPPLQKYIHRKAIEPFVPVEIAQRTDKAIFSAPLQSQWLKKELKSEVEDLFASASFRKRGIWNLPLVHRNWELYKNGKSAHAEMIFNIIAMEKWFRIHHDHAYPEVL